MSRNSKMQPVRLVAIVEDLRFPLDEGAKKTCFSLICSLRERGLRVSIFTWYRNPALDDAFPLPRNKFLFGFSFASILRAQAPDMILYMPASSGTIGAFVRAAAVKAQSPGVPLALLNLQYRDLPECARYFGLRRFADIVFTQSAASTDVFRSLGCRTIRLPGGVDRSVFRPVNLQEKHLLRARYRFQDTDRIVLHIGHCNRDRNVLALARLVGLGFKVVLVASTSTAVDHGLLLELRLAGATVITDFVENIQHFYQLADCYVFPVLSPTSAIDAPLSVLEAMACNLPVVTTPFGALPNMFESGQGLYYADTEERMLDLVQLAVEQQGCTTVEKVSPYSWDRAASTILGALTERHPL